jgi:hypothetical protein
LEEEAGVNLKDYLGVIFRISERQVKDVPPEAAAVTVATIQIQIPKPNPLTRLVVF